VRVEIHALSSAPTESVRIIVVTARAPTRRRGGCRPYTSCHNRCDSGSQRYKAHAPPKPLQHFCAPCLYRGERPISRPDQSRPVKNGHVGFRGTFMIFITTWIFHWMMCHCQKMKRQCIAQPHKSSQSLHEKSLWSFTSFETVSFQAAHRMRAHPEGTVYT